VTRTRDVLPSLALAGAILVAGGTAAGAQDAAPAGRVLTFGISSDFRVSDNLNLDLVSPGTATVWDTRLSFGFLTETRTSRFALGLDGVVRLADVPGADTAVRLDDPGLTLGYSREAANSRLSFDAELRRTNLDFIDPLDLADIDPTDLVTDTGRREIRRATLAFETGINDPLGFLVELDHSERLYTGTTDPELFDRRTDTVEATARMRLSPVAEGRVTAALEEYRAEDAPGTERTTRSLSLGLSYQVAPDTTLDAEIGSEEIEERLAVPPGTTTDRGAFGTLALTRRLPNGTLGLTLERSFSPDGARTTLSASRALDLPAGSLAFSLGASRGERGDTEAVASLDYLQRLPDGEFTAALAREVSTDDDGEDVLTTRAELGYSHRLTPISSVAFGLDHVETDDLGSGTVTPADRSSFTATYTHALTRDWDLSAGYEYRRRSTTGGGDAHSNTVFVTLERDFRFRP